MIQDITTSHRWMNNSDTCRGLGSSDRKWTAGSCSPHAGGGLPISSEDLQTVVWGGTDREAEIGCWGTKARGCVRMEKSLPSCQNWQKSFCGTNNENDNDGNRRKESLHRASPCCVWGCVASDRWESPWRPPLTTQSSYNEHVSFRAGPRTSGRSPGPMSPVHLVGGRVHVRCLPREVMVPGWTMDYSRFDLELDSASVGRTGLIQISTNSKLRGLKGSAA